MTNPAPSLNSTVRYRGRSYLVVSVEAFGPNMVKARRGREGFNVGLQRGRSVYLACWCSVACGFYGRPIAV